MKPEIIVSLDSMQADRYDYSKSWDIVRKLGKDQEWYKVGLRTIFSFHGIAFIELLKQREKKKIMLDAKLYDVETTTRDALRQLIKYVKPDFITVANNVKIALEEETSNTKMVEVFSLTDGSNGSTTKYAEKYISASAFVCPPSLVDDYRLLYPNKIIISPGVRLTEYSDEHKGSTAIPKNADYIVVGRPIINSSDYKKELDSFKKAIEDINR